MVAHPVSRVEKPDEIRRYEPGPLVQQLVIRMLAVGTRRPPDDRAGGQVDRFAVQRDGFAVAFHVELLEVGRELGQVVVVRQHGMGLGVEKVVVPHSDEPEQDRACCGRRGPAGSARRWP